MSPVFKPEELRADSTLREMDYQHSSTEPQDMPLRAQRFFHHFGNIVHVPYATPTNFSSATPFADIKNERIVETTYSSQQENGFAAYLPMKEEMIPRDITKFKEGVEYHYQEFLNGDKKNTHDENAGERPKLDILSTVCSLALIMHSDSKSKYNSPIKRGFVVDESAFAEDTKDTKSDVEIAAALNLMLYTKKVHEKLQNLAADESHRQGPLTRSKAAVRHVFEAIVRNTNAVKHEGKDDTDFSGLSHVKNEADSPVQDECLENDEREYHSFSSDVSQHSASSPSKKMEIESEDWELSKIAKPEENNPEVSGVELLKQEETMDITDTLPIKEEIERKWARERASSSCVVKIVDPRNSTEKHEDEKKSKCKKSLMFSDQIGRKSCLKEAIYDCDNCSKRFRARAYLRNHMKIHYIAKHECTKCGKVFANADYLRRHVKVTHTPGGFECGHCGRRFKGKQYLKQHINDHIGIKNVCKECSRTFKSESGLKRHMRIHTSEAFACKKCDRKFVSKQNFLKHIETHPGVKKFKCSQCGLRYFYRANLIEHIKFECGVKHECKVCCKLFAKKKHYLQHITLHEGKTHVCDICDKSFLSRSYLLQHKKSHEGILHECDQCSRHFTTRNALTKHKSSKHQGIFECDECLKNFPSKLSLKNHLKIHEGIKYDCKICLKKFSSATYLEQHCDDVHKGIKHKCSECTEEFKSKHFLKKHMNSEHKGIKFECDMCLKSFSTKAYLMLHVKGSCSKKVVEETSKRNKYLIRVKKPEIEPRRSKRLSNGIQND